MMVKRKRAPGGGRKPRGDFAELETMFSLRMPLEIRRQLDAAATKNRRSAAQELLARLNSSLARGKEKNRDGALSSLLFLITQLAERISDSRFADKASRA